jgi:hypothetical protein
LFSNFIEIITGRNQNNILLRFSILIIFVFFSYSIVFPQQKITEVDTINIYISNETLNEIRENQVEYVRDQDINFKAELSYINGQEYYVYFKPSISSSLFRFEELRKGSLFYNGKEWKDLNLHYDTFTDRLILFHIDERSFFQMIELNSMYIDSAKLEFSDKSLMLINTEFRVAKDNTNKKGFFEIVSIGDIKYIIKHRSVSEFYKSEKYYPYSPEEFIYLNSKIYKIKSKRSLLKLFPDEHRPELKKYIRKSKFRIRRNELDPELVPIIKFAVSLQ